MKNKHGIILLFSSLLVSSCGYQFEGGRYLYENVPDVAVSVMENKSSESGAGITFTNALIREIIEKTDTKVVDASEASMILKGSVNSITFSTLSRSTSESAIERNVSATIDIKLLDRDGAIIWSVKGVSSDEAYTVSEDAIADETNKREAVDIIADRSAEKVVSKMTANF